MSYILDALKKSDHERNHGSVPGLQTVHIPMSLESTVTRWPYIVIALLMLSLAFVLGMLRPWDSFITETPTGKYPIETFSNNGTKEEQKVIAPITEPVVIASNNLSKIKTAPQIIPSLPKMAEVIQPLEPSKAEKYQVVNKPKAVLVTATKAPSLEMDSVPHLYDMPGLVQQAIPDMTFAGHVYSSDLRQRSVIVNGRSMGEGEIIIEGLSVEQITHNGVIFNYQGQLFRMDILQDWSFD